MVERGESEGHEQYEKKEALRVQAEELLGHIEKLATMGNVDEATGDSVVGFELLTRKGPLKVTAFRAGIVGETLPFEEQLRAKRHREGYDVGAFLEALGPEHRRPDAALIVERQESEGAFMTQYHFYREGEDFRIEKFDTVSGPEEGPLILEAFFGADREEQVERLRGADEVRAAEREAGITEPEPEDLQRENKLLGSLISAIESEEGSR